MEEKTRPSFALRALALIVLLLAAWFLLRVVIGLVAGVAWIVVVVLAVVAVVWAWRTLSSS
jgi:ABC-type protease/lipase transport system fused ATPase/permease subunit